MNLVSVPSSVFGPSSPSAVLERLFPGLYGILSDPEGGGGDASRYFPLGAFLLGEGDLYESSTQELHGGLRHLLQVWPRPGTLPILG